MAAGLQSTGFKETFIEKLQLQNVEEFRSIRLDEWRQGDKIHRNWTYINSQPLDGSEPISQSSACNAQTVRLASSSKTEKRADPPSPKVRRKKQERVLERERLEFDEERKRHAEHERNKERIEVKDSPSPRAAPHVKQQVNVRPHLSRTSRRQVQAQSSTGGQEYVMKVNALEPMTNLVNEDPEAHRLWMDMVTNVREATNSLRYCQKNIGEGKLPGVNEGCERMEEICRAVDQLTHVVIQKK